MKSAISVSSFGIKGLLFVTSLLFCCCFPAESDAQNWEWIKSTDGIDAESVVGSAIANDPFGHVFVGGMFQGTCLTFDTAVLGSIYDSYSILAKFDSSGNLIWQQYASSNGTYGISLIAIAADEYGNCYATGVFGAPSATFGSYTLTTTQMESIFLVKYDQNGNVVWAENSTGSPPSSSYNEHVQDIYIDNNGNAILCGNVGDQYMSIGGSAVNNSAFYSGTNASMFLAKFDSSGSLLWSITAADPTCISCSAIGNSVVTDAANNVYVVGDNSGYFLKFDTTTLIGSNFFAKYSSDGTFIWAKCYGIDSDQTAPNTFSCLGINQAKNELYFSGTFDYSEMTFGDITLSNPLAGSTGVNAAFFLIQSDLDGNIQWAKTAYGSAVVQSLAVDANNNINVSGYFWDSTIIFNGTYTVTALSATTTYPGFLTNFSSDGNVNWGMSLGKNNSEITPALSADYFGNLYATCDYIGDTMFYQNGYFLNSNRFTSAGSDNIFVAKLGGIESVPMQPNGNVNMVLYPNPAKTELVVRFNAMGMNEITITDEIGRIVIRQHINQANLEFSLNLNLLLPGLYFVNAVGKGGNCIQPFIKE